MAPSPTISLQIDGKPMETVRNFIILPSISLQMVTTVMKLKDTSSLEEKM